MKYTTLEKELVSGLRILKKDTIKMAKQVDLDREAGGDPGYEPIVGEVIDRLDLLLDIAKKYGTRNV